jgi:hypothetical protein
MTGPPSRNISTTWVSLGVEAAGVALPEASAGAAAGAAAGAGAGVAPASWAGRELRKSEAASKTSARMPLLKDGRGIEGIIK